MLCDGYTLEGIRVLFVDNRADDCELYRLVFVGCGAEITIVNSAHDALETFDHVVPDILVSDITLADEDGYDLIRRLRARGSSIPAVAVSGFAYDRDRQAAFAAGFSDYLPKPVEPAALISSVARLLGLARKPPVPPS
jgi:CheY-like chemotaxis protein